MAEIWSYEKNFDFWRDISPGDAFFVPLEQMRGDYRRQKLLQAFSLDSVGSLRPGADTKTRELVLFGGHIGCGKSTELRAYARLLRNTYTVREIEISRVLDINNLRFSDLLIALAHQLVEAFQDASLSLTPSPALVNPVVEWFDTRIIKQERFKDIEGEIKTEASAGGGIPFLAKLLGTLTAKFRGGASYREELRRELQDGFTVLLGHFNALISHANTLLQAQSRGPLVFLIDGTDKLKREDSSTFFQVDVHQLAQIQTNLIICAPISVLLEEGQAWHRFTRVQLPMVKVRNANGSARKDEEDVLIKLVLERLPINFFESEAVVRYLVSLSGGHLRDLLRLIKACFARIDLPCITQSIAEASVRDVASEYQRLVRGEDWADLVAIDRANGDEKDRTPERLRMLYDLVLLEYNNFWWRTHPLVSSLAGYKKAESASK